MSNFLEDDEASSLEDDVTLVVAGCLAALRALRFSLRSLASRRRCSRSSLDFAMVVLWVVGGPMYVRGSYVP